MLPSEFCANDTKKIKAERHPLPFNDTIEDNEYVNSISNETRSSDAAADVEEDTPSWREESNTTSSKESEERPWEVKLLDADELEDLAFSVRRVTAREKLLKLADLLRELATREQREDEVRIYLEKKKKRITGSTEADRAELCDRKNPFSVVTEENESPQPEVGVRISESNAGGEKSGVGESGGSGRTVRNKTIQELLGSPTPQERAQLLNDSRLPNRKRRHEDITGTTQHSDSVTASSASSRKEASLQSSPLPIPNNSSSSPTSSFVSPPTLKSKDRWVIHHLPGDPTHCPDFSSHRICPMGPECTRAHVCRDHFSHSNSGTISTAIQFTREDLIEVYELHRSTPLQHTHYLEKIKPNSLNQPRYTSCLLCPIDRIYYYPSAGPSGRMSDQGIWWYPTIKEARDCVSTIAMKYLQYRNIVPRNYIPLMQRKQKTTKTVSCAISTPNETNQGNANFGTCKLKKMRMQTPHSSVQAAAMLAAKDAQTTSSSTPHPQPPPLSSSVTLPLVHPFNWMELGFRCRCSDFIQTSFCPRGRTCPLAHVHFPSPVVSPPSFRLHPLALQRAYQINFCWPCVSNGQCYDFSPHYKIVSAAPSWHAIGFRCPVENIIYYGAGGATAMVNSQNICLYPTIEDAKLAVIGVVLNAFASRGLHSSWDVSSTLHDAPINPQLTAKVSYGREK